MSRSGIRWEGNLRTNIEQLDDRMKRGVVAAANWVAPQAEEYMRTNAPWTDRTSAARNGLHSQVEIEGGGDKVAIVLYHTVPYGPYLELRWDGKYAIIEPTMAAMGPLFVEAIGRLAFDEGGLG